MIKHIASLFAILFTVTSSYTQDIHFSHLHASPLNLNPAMAGMFEGQVRLIGNYRNQWKSVTADYKTYMFSADANLSGFNQNSVIGIGGQVLSDVAGDLEFRTNSTSLSLSVMQAFDRDKSHLLAGGIQIGRVSSSFNPGNIVAYDEEPMFAADDASRSSYYDISAGLLWYKRFWKKQFLYLGASIFHVNNPDVSFFNEVTGNTLYRRYVIHGGANIVLNDFYTLVPTFILMDQGPHEQCNFGTFVRYNNPSRLPNGQKASLMLGGWLRAFSLENRLGADAFVAAVRIDYANLTFTFTYDVNISTLSRVSAGRGGPEFSLIYLLGTELGGKMKKEKDSNRKKRSKMKCPVF